MALKKRKKKNIMICLESGRCRARAPATIHHQARDRDHFARLRLEMRPRALARRARPARRADEPQRPASVITGACRLPAAGYRLLDAIIFAASSGPRRPARSWCVGKLWRRLPNGGVLAKELAGPRVFRLKSHREFSQNEPPPPFVAAIKFTSWPTGGRNKLQPLTDMGQNKGRAHALRP